jgi:L-lactate permease
VALVNPDYNGKNRDVLYVSITIIAAVFLFAMSVSVLSESTLDHHIAAVTPFKTVVKCKITHYSYLT